MRNSKDYSHCSSKEITCDDCLTDLREALIEAKREETEIVLITAAGPPVANPPNVTGIVRKVNAGTIELRLTLGQPGRTGIFSICQIIGFVPRSDD